MWRPGAGSRCERAPNAASLTCQHASVGDMGHAPPLHAALHSDSEARNAGGTIPQEEEPETRGHRHR